MYTHIQWNSRDSKSIKAAERKKARLESKGYNLAHEMVNSITGDCTLSYNPPLPDVIVVNIPVQVFDRQKYFDGGNCYLAEQLKKLFPDSRANIKVKSYGESTIDKTEYISFDTFSNDSVEAAFDKGESIEVILLKL